MAKQLAISARLMANPPSRKATPTGAPSRSGRTGSNVGLNEWGHTFWFMEELFVALLHWGFVFFGWMALGVFGVVLQQLTNIHRLIGEEGIRLPTAE
jgi:Ammonia monooxygenase/methane monooxygenase, subunit C